MMNRAGLATAYAVVAASIYLEEYAQKEPPHGIIEVISNNLQCCSVDCVRSAWDAVFIQLLQSAGVPALVGGLVLTLMNASTIIQLRTRSALRAVPSSIRRSALGLGASKRRWCSPCLPLAAPGILTGTLSVLLRRLVKQHHWLLIAWWLSLCQYAATADGWDPATALPVSDLLWAPMKLSVLCRTDIKALLSVLLLFLASHEYAAIIPAPPLERRLVNGEK
ncbi:hypothetical protein FQA39_LY19414 [Lamprigera yunnana]|nr:hypothetical protein FQA39_LY19414 [Lamprigera yunnana]